MKMPKKSAWFRASLAMVLSAQVAYAETLRQTGQDAPADADYQTLRQQLAEQAKSLAEQQQRLAQEMDKLAEAQRRIQAMQGQLGMPAEINPQRLAQADESTFRGRGDEAGRLDSTTLDVATVFSQPSILTPKGTFVFDPSLQYSFSSSDRVTVVGFSVLNAVLIGAIDVRSVNRNNLIATLGGRYGLTNRLEVEARVPYIYRRDDSLSRRISGSAIDESFNSDGSGIGDIELAARYQLNVPTGDAPFYVAGLRLKTRTGKDQYEVAYDTDFNLPKELPTGSGFYSLQPSLSMVLPADPVVFFGGINYTWNIKRDVNASIPFTNSLGTVTTRSIGEVDPGDSLGLNVGMGLGLNERSSFSLSYEHTWIDKTRLDGQVADGSMWVQLATLQAGFSYRLNKRINFNLSIGAGLTDDTPDTTVTLRLPIRF
ncbi:transporter [Thiobacillus sp. 65-1402]|uniref:transporter n=1 Tax=Thiobacillus sp. 65-1402 TaxID=1895861 RepID=UPI00095C8B3C|nr:transporter [Thiobacillus sp. 65-1402]OJW96526.1 MAG: hypothetical protein BGO62_04580 [Thiobacillus sp. 65-1402]